MIEKLLKAAHEANLVHFPQWIIFKRQPGSGWSVLITKEGGESSINAHASGTTPEDAMENLRRSLVERLREAEASAGREAARKADAAKQLESAPRCSP